MHRTFTSNVDAFEEDGDRLAVKFQTKDGFFWISASRAEQVALLRRSLGSGAPVEVTYDVASLEIADVILRRS
jgi:hypothetical protein